ncbi:MAG: hypothetical protein DRG83_03635 [Deltaproteobacteria bacterium]|nr:MAG: hypothetical protein DRG83_03635 [Deltaproteobacteria bacterium]
MFICFKRKKGATLIELLVALFISAILVAGIYSLFITQQRSYSVQDQVAAVQQDARAAITLMARELRMAGFLTGPGSSGGFTDGSDTFSINGYNFAVVPSNSTNGPDSITVVFAAKELGEVESIGSGSVTLDRNVDNYFKTNGTLNPTKCYVSFETLGGRIFRVTNVSTSQGKTILTLSSFEPGEIDIGEKVFGVKAITYTLNADHSELERNENTGGGAQAIAGAAGEFEVVEDLQIAYQVEGVSYWTFDGVTETAKGEINDSTLPSDNTHIRLIRINLVVRTPREDPEEVKKPPDQRSYYRPAVEDHPASNTRDGHRRRILTTVVKVRNLGLVQ